MRQCVGCAALQLHGVQLLRSSPLFKDADDGFVHAICHFMTEEFYLKGDLVYQKGDPADALCFVGYGTPSALRGAVGC